MCIVIPYPDETPYTDADLDAIIAASKLPVLSGKKAELRSRLQRMAAIEIEFQGGEFEKRGHDWVIAGSQRTKDGRTGRPRGAVAWNHNLVELFLKFYRPQLGRPFCEFYREASRRLIESLDTTNRGFDLSYLLFAAKNHGIQQELANETILRTARRRRD